MQHIAAAKPVRKRLWIVLASVLLVLPVLAVVLLADSFVASPCLHQKGESGIAACKSAGEHGWLRQGTRNTLLKRLGKLQYDGAHYADAVATLTPLVENNVASFYDYSNRGVSFYFLGENSKAIADFKMAQSLRPDDEANMSDLLATLNETEQYEEAIKLSGAFLLKHPEAAGAQWRLAEGLYYTGKAAEAKVEVDRALKLLPDDAAVHNLHGLILDELQENGAALAAYSEGVKRDPENVVYLTNRGLMYNELEDYEKAINDLTAALQLSRNIDTLLGLALTYIDANQGSSALPFLVEAHSLNLKKARTDFAWGRYHAWLAHYKEAKTAFLDALAQNPEHNESRYWLGISEYYLNNANESLAIFEPLLKVWPESAMLRSDIADSLLDLERYDDALKMFDDALRMQPGNSYFFQRRSRLYGIMQRYQDAASDARIAIALDPNNAVAHTRLAFALWRSGDAKTARLQFDKALTLSNNAIGIALERADFLFQIGDMDAVRQVTTDLATTASGWSKWHRLSGLLAEYDNKPAEALKHYETARELMPQDAWALEDIAWAQIANDQPAAALQSCDEMVARLPKAAASYRCRAKAFSRMFREDESLKELDRALEIDPEFHAASLDKAYVLLDKQAHGEALPILTKLIKNGYRLPTTYYYRGLALEGLKQPGSAAEDYEIALDLADAAFAPVVSTQLNRLKLKQPMGRQPERQLYPPKRFAQ